MEGVNIEKDLKDLLLTIQIAKNLVDDGKEVKCSFKLQSAFTKCRNIYYEVQQKRIVADKPDEQISEE